jgi:hypothetical protein
MLLERQRGELHSKQAGSGLCPLLLKIKPVKEMKANAPGGGTIGQVGKAFKCTVFCVGDSMVTFPQAQGEFYHQKADCKSRQPWPELTFHPCLTETSC